MIRAGLAYKIYDEYNQQLNNAPRLPYNEAVKDNTSVAPKVLILKKK